MSTTEQVLGHHLEAFGSGNMDEIMSDYTDDSVLFTPDGVLSGPEQIKGLFTAMFAEWGKPGANFEMIRQDVNGETAYIIWKGETADNVYEYATDTFTVRDGKIVAQSFAGKIRPKV